MPANMKKAGIKYQKGGMFRKLLNLFKGKKKKPNFGVSHPDDLVMKQDHGWKTNVAIGKKGESFSDMWKRYERLNTKIIDRKKNITYDPKSRSFNEFYDFLKKKGNKKQGGAVGPNGIL